MKKYLVYLNDKMAQSGLSPFKVSALTYRWQTDPDRVVFYAKEDEDGVISERATFNADAVVVILLENENGTDT